MENTRAKNTIVSILQASLTGQLTPFSKFNPQFVAKAIVDKVEFDRTYGESNAKKQSETLETLRNAILSMEEEMNNEMATLGADEKLLANFIKGRSTSHKIMLELINQIK